MISTSPARNSWIDLLRVAAIVAVVCTHVLIFCPGGIWTSVVLDGHNLTWLLFTPAWGGVWVFFVLAGYLTGRGYATGRYATSWPGCRRFWWNRFLRVCLPYYFAVFVVVVFMAPETLQRSNWGTLAHMLTFTYGVVPSGAPLSQTWYVSTLVQLLVLAPLLALGLTPLLWRPRLALSLGVAILAAGTLIRLAPTLTHPGTSVKDWWPVWTYVPVWVNIDLFAAGFLMNALTLCRRSVAPLWLRPWFVLPVFVVVWLVTSRVAYSALIVSDPGAWPLFAIGGPLLWMGASALWIAMAEAAPPAPVNVTGSRPKPLGWIVVEVLAALSYGVYLWHVPVLQSISSVVHRSTPLEVWAVLLAATAVLSLAMAAIVRLTVERSASLLRLDPKAASSP